MARLRIVGLTDDDDGLEKCFELVNGLGSILNMSVLENCSQGAHLTVLKVSESYRRSP